ncbi:MAG: Stp1/IreP family PP2C-type Ser/Thr phosphatase [Desulforhopalus sp.]|nr:Stp1/IreP family PP2C-type Ser/Thr phosphatase [Desulforhopalus sp.]
MKSPIHITASCHTDPGLVRSHNEDTCFVNDKQSCFLVADGMGGAAAGEVASGLIKETAQDLFSVEQECSSSELSELIRECFKTANARILAHAAETPSNSGMGCTAELLAFGKNDFVLGHVGDSRTYLLREGCLKQLTRDHTLVQDQEDQGFITREQAKEHALRHIILRVVGNNEELDVDITHGSALPDDIFLLCTDGLTNMVDDENIEKIMAYDVPLALKATMLVDQANYAGGKDNVSVVLIEIN